MSHHVAVRLPEAFGGLHAVADYRQPIVTVMRRHNERLSTDPANKTGHGVGSLDDERDMALIAEWLINCPEQACTFGRDDLCTHPPASAEPFTPAKYKPPVLDGLW